MYKKKIVVALGHDALGYNLPKQRKAVTKTAVALADLIETNGRLIITHSNGPQVSMIHKAMNELGRIYPEYTPAPMSVCSAMSQGYIGYDIQQALRSELLSRGIYKTVSTILTQVVVDPYDEAFYEPNKMIGRMMTKEEAALEEGRGNYVTELEEGFCRVIAAPKPMEIVELDAIHTLVNADQVVIAGGGGGVPVIEQSHSLKGASAVIEKDSLAARLSIDLRADQLIFLTEVEKVKKYFGSDQEEEIEFMRLQAAKEYIEEGHFGQRTMLPKIAAAVEYLEAVPHGNVLITSLEHAGRACKGLTGTLIIP